MTSRRNAGFTLLEMVVVLAIIAGLAAIMIPMVGGVRGKSALAADVSNQADLTKGVLTFAELHGGNFPDVFDSLLEIPEGGGDPVDVYGDTYVTLRGMGSGPGLKAFDLLWAGGPPNAGVKAIHGLGKLGIGGVIDHDADEEYPNDSTDGVDVRALDYSATCNIAILDADEDENSGEAAYGRVVDIYEHYGLNLPDYENIDNAVTGDDDVNGDSTYRIAVFGLGKANTMIGSNNGGLQTSPYSTSADSNNYYTRYLLLFQLPNSMGGEAEFLGVLNCQGLLQKENETRFNEYED